MPISTDHLVERFSRNFSYMGIAQTVTMTNGVYVKQKKPPGNEGVLSVRNCSGFKGQGWLEGKLLRAMGKDSERMRMGLLYNLADSCPHCVREELDHPLVS